MFAPIQSLPWFLRFISFLNPFTTASIIVRDIMIKGYGMNEPSVIYAFINSFIWIISFIFIVIKVLHSRKYK
jgi:ABC-type polysaccharide/polyol phosphate export permease